MLVLVLALALALHNKVLVQVPGLVLVPVLVPADRVPVLADRMPVLVPGPVLVPAGRYPVLPVLQLSPS